MELIHQLEQSGQDTLALYDLPDAALEAAYAPGKWTVRQMLHHLADAETVLHDRVRRTICEPKPIQFAFDQDAWCAALDYGTQPLAISRALYAATRASVIDLAKRFYLSHGAREYVHTEVGLRTAKQEFDKIAWHNSHHLQQIRQALATRV